MKNTSLSKTTFKTAVSAVVAALSVVMMFMTGLLPFMTYALPAIAGLLIVIVVIEISKGWAIYTYVAVSLLSLIIAPDKEAAIVYVLFFGYYPILKSVLEKKILKRVAEWVIKLIIFNIALLGAYLAIRFILVPAVAEEPFGVIMTIVVWALANLMFVLYDIALTRLITLYIYKIRKYVFKKNILKK